VIEGKARAKAIGACPVPQSTSAARAPARSLAEVCGTSGSYCWTSMFWCHCPINRLVPAQTSGGRPTGRAPPYQQLIPLMDEGVGVGKTLAWAPEGRGVEFSYVTEHLSDDAAIESLSPAPRLRRAGHTAR
jgi:hypothetical protein